MISKELFIEISKTAMLLSRDNPDIDKAVLAEKLWDLLQERLEDKKWKSGRQERFITGFTMENIKKCPINGTLL